MFMLCIKYYLKMFTKIDKLCSGLLKFCLRMSFVFFRNFGMGNTECQISTASLNNQKCEFTITVGKHSATVSSGYES